MLELARTLVLVLELARKPVLELDRNPQTAPFGSYSVACLWGDNKASQGYHDDFGGRSSWCVGDRTVGVVRPLHQVASLYNESKLLTLMTVHIRV